MEFEATEHAIEEDFKEEAAFYKKFGVTSDEFFDLIVYPHDDRVNYSNLKKSELAAVR